jgi:hypothetical protein
MSELIGPRIQLLIGQMWGKPTCYIVKDNRDGFRSLLYLALKELMETLLSRMSNPNICLVETFGIEGHEEFYPSFFTQYF